MSKSLDIHMLDELDKLELDMLLDSNDEGGKKLAEFLEKVDFDEGGEDSAEEMVKVVDDMVQEGERGEYEDSWQGAIENFDLTGMAADEAIIFEVDANNNMLGPFNVVRVEKKPVGPPSLVCREQPPLNKKRRLASGAVDLADPSKGGLPGYSMYGVKLGRRSTVVVEQQVSAKENRTREKQTHSELINKLVQENKSRRNPKFMEDVTNITDQILS